MPTIVEQIAAYEARRAANVAKMAEIMQKAGEEGATLDASDQEEFDGLGDDNEAIDAHLARLERVQKESLASARPVNADPARSERTRAPVQVKAPAPEPGIRLARFVRCLGLATKQHRDIYSIAESEYGTRDPEFVAAMKSAGTAQPGLTSINTPALIGNEGGFGDFADFLRPMTLLGRFGTNGIPALRRVPFRVPLVNQTHAGDAWWVPEGKGKPLTRARFGRSELSPMKVATISVATMELLRDSSPAAEALIRDDLAAAIAARLDRTFIDPTNAGSGQPQSVNYSGAITPIAGSGNDLEAVYADAQAMIGAFVGADNPLTSGVWIMPAVRALAVSMMRNELGQLAFPSLSAAGGTFFGMPVLTTSYSVTADSVTLINASDIFVADDGGVSVDMSTEASLQMVAGDDEGATNHVASGHTNDGTPGTPVAVDLVSMFQTNSVAFRAERTINWARRRSTGVALLSPCEWGDPDSA